MEIIHIVLGKANPDRMNGVNKVVYQLATHQSRAGLHVSVWGITSSPEKNYGARNFTTRLYQKHLNPFKPDEKLLQYILSKKGKAIFHIHGGWVPLFSTLAQFMGKHQVPFVFTPHGAYNTIAMRRSFFIKRIYFGLFEKKILRNARLIHCIGQSEVTGLAGIYKTDKTLLLPYGFDIHDKDLVFEPKSHSFIIGFVGRIDIYTKGLDLLLEAFAQFVKQVPHARLWIVGDGPERKKLEKIAKHKGITEQTVFWGSKFGEEKNRLIRQMDVFAHPSRNEGLPSSVLEACENGVPCIVSRATNMGEYIEQYGAGFAVADEDLNGIIFALQALHQLRSSASYQQMRRNARELVKLEFNWNTLVKAFNQLYTE